MSGTKAYSLYEYGELIGDIDKGIITQAYKTDPGETLLFMLLIATDDPGAYSFTRTPIPVNGTVNLVNASDGNDHLLNPTGRDWIYKMFWCNFDQPMKFQIYRANVPDVTCECYIPAYVPTYLTTFDIGWSRSQLESTDQETTHYHYLTNMGGAPAKGKAWLLGMYKEGTYDFF